VDGCWGACIDIESCGYLDDCSLCELTGKLCRKVSWDFGGPLSDCTDPPPPSCDPVTCDCLDPDICGLPKCGIVDELEVVHCLAYVPSPPEDENPCYDGAAGTAAVTGRQLPDGGFTLEPLPQP
jgi:hypothetical protein